MIPFLAAFDLVQRMYEELSCKIKFIKFADVRDEEFLQEIIDLIKV